MEVSLLKTLLDSFSRFGSLSSNYTVKAEIAHRYYLKIEEILEPLRPVFEEVIVYELASDEKLKRTLKDLDVAVNEARELMEKWHQMMSKVYFVMQIEPAINKLRAAALETWQLLNTFLEDNSCSPCMENCMLKMQQLSYKQTSFVIKEAIRAQVDQTVPRPEHLEKISNFLSLSSNRELLMEAVALDKLKAELGRSEHHAEIEGINQMIALVKYMHDCYVKAKQMNNIIGVPIPADFCCPLSLDLMSDPVIAESGQTYERAFIKQWLDQGCNICPKTRRTLGHTNLIPNYTVKAFIANWCESNEIKLPDPINSMNLNRASGFYSLSGSSANGSTVPHSSQSPRDNHPRSPALLIKYSVSSNGLQQDGHLHEKPTPPHYPASLGEVHVGSRNGASCQLQQDPSQSPKVDERFQDHSRSASASSHVSIEDCHEQAWDAIMGSPTSSDLTHFRTDASGEIRQDAPASCAPPSESEYPPGLAEARLRSQSILCRPSGRSVPRIISSPYMELRPDLSGVESEVRKFVEDLRSDSVDVQREAIGELRLLAKHNMENRIVIASCGAISLFVGLLHSTDQKIQENAVTTLLNLSLNDNNKRAIANADAIDPLVHVLETGNSEAKENAAATLSSLSVTEENKVRIGRSGAIQPLVDMLRNGTPLGKKDAVRALFNLSIFHENRVHIVHAGAVRHLVELMDPAVGMVYRVVSLLANLATTKEGRMKIGHEGGIPVLVEVVELGSARAKEHAASALLQLCSNSNMFCSQVLQEGAVPPLVALSQSGTARAKEKAHNLLSYLRSQQYGWKRITATN